MPNANSRESLGDETGTGRQATRVDSRAAASVGLTSWSHGMNMTWDCVSWIRGGLSWSEGLSLFSISRWSHSSPFRPPSFQKLVPPCSGYSGLLERWLADIHGGFGTALHEPGPVRRLCDSPSRQPRRPGRVAHRDDVSIRCPRVLQLPRAVLCRNVSSWQCCRHSDAPNGRVRHSCHSPCSDSLRRDTCHGHRRRHTRRHRHRPDQHRIRSGR